MAHGELAIQRVVVVNCPSPVFHLRGDVAEGVVVRNRIGGLEKRKEGIEGLKGRT